MLVKYRILFISAFLVFGSIAVAYCANNRAYVNNRKSDSSEAVFTFIKEMVTGNPFDIAAIERRTHIALHIKQSTSHDLLYEGNSNADSSVIDKIELNIWKNGNKRIASFYVNKRICLSFDRIRAKYGQPVASHLPSPPAPGNIVSPNTPENWGIGYKRGGIMIGFEFTEWLETNPNPCVREFGFTTSGDS